LIFSLVLIASLLSACAEWLPDAHRPDLTQGNAIKQSDLAKLRPGMNKAKVVEIIGSPTLLDPFHAERWDYIYRYIPGRGQAEQSRLSLFFNGDILQRIDDSAYTPPIERNEDGQESDPPSPADKVLNID
jgi:outer membrane protein assembly factor BamE